MCWGVERNSHIHLVGVGVCQHHPQSCLWVRLHGFPRLQQRWSMPAGSSLSCQTETLSEGSQNNWEVSCLCTQNKTSTFFPSLCKSFSWQQHNSPGSSVPWVTEACDPAAGCHFHGNPWFSKCYCFCFTTSTAYRLFLQVSGLVPCVRNLEDISTLLLVWAFEQLPCKRKRFNKMCVEKVIGCQEYRRGICKSVGTIEMDEFWWWWQVTATFDW